MKKVILTALLAISTTTFAQAKSVDYMDKIVKLYNLKTGGALEFNATKSGDGYNLLVKPTNRVYKEIFSNKPMHISVDEGPIVTTPSMTLATAGLKASGSAFDLFNPKLLKDAKSSVKHIPTYNYEAIVSFGGELDEKTTIEPIEIENGDVEAKVSKTLITNKFDLDSFTGKSTLKVDNITVKPKKEDGLFELKNLSLITKVTQEPIDDIMLFADTTIKVDKINFKAIDRKKQEIYANFNATIKGSTKRVDSKLLDMTMSYDLKALDAKTIALTKGVKESKLTLELKNLGIDGFVDFVKLSKELEKLNNELYSATSKNDDIAMQKAIVKQQEVLNRAVDIFNKTFIGNKSKIALNLELQSDKKSFAKIDLLYKGKPVSGNIQSLMITLMAQQLNLFDGDFEVQLDSQLASSINPFAIMGLDLLKAKGFATVKDGVYHLKGQIKDGKIVINGKAYNIPELTKALF